MPPVPRIRLGASAILMLARCAGAGLGVLLQILLARALGAGNLGIYYAAVSLIAVAAVVGAFGYPSLATRFVARYRTEARRRFLAAFLWTGLFDTLAVATALAICVGVFAWGQEPAMRNALFAASFSIPAMAVARFLSAVGAADRRFLSAFLPELVVRPAVLLCLVLIVFAVGASLTANTVLSVYAVLSWSFVLLQLRVFRERAQGAGGLQERQRLASYWRRLAATLIALPLLTTMLADIHILLLALLLPPESVGIFGAALKIAALFAFAVQIIQQTSMPDLAEAARDRRLPQALQATAPANFAAILIAVASALAVFLGGRAGLTLFGAEFQVAYAALIIAVIGILPRALAGPSLQLLVVTKHHRAAIAAASGALATLAGMSIALVPAFGINGAATAFVGAGVVSSLLSGFLLWRLEGVRSDAFAHARNALAPSGFAQWRRGLAGLTLGQMNSGPAVNILPWCEL